MGSQRLQCQSCRRQYTHAPLPLRYDDKTREAALKLYLEGNGLRRIGRLPSVNHQSVANWVNPAHARLKARHAPASEPAAAGTPEMDELFVWCWNQRQSHRQRRPRATRATSSTSSHV